MAVLPHEPVLRSISISEIVAAVDEEGESELGRLAVEVAEATPTPEEPEDEPTPTATPEPEGEEEEPAPTPEPTDVPVPNAIAAGLFELGGQTHTLEHPDLMHYAGMTWAKRQIRFSRGAPGSGRNSRSPSGISANNCSMSSRQEIETPTLPTSPQAMGSSAS